MNGPASTGSLRPTSSGPAALAVVSVLLLGLSWAAYAGHTWVLRALSRSLTQRLGVPVSIGGLHSTLTPAVVLEDLRLGGGSQPLLTVQQAEVVLKLHGTSRPSVRQVRLLRPVLSVASHQWPSAATLRVVRRQPQSSRRRAVATQRHAARPDLLIEDGRMSLELLLGGEPTTLSSEGLYLRGRRLVLGHTALARGGRLIAELASAAADLRRTPTFRIERGAALAARLHVPGAGDTALSIYRISLGAAPHGYTMALVGKTAGYRTGRFTARLRTEGRSGTAIIDLRGVDLSALDPLLEPIGLRTAGTRLSGYVKIVRASGGYHVQTALNTAGLALRHPLVAPQAVGPFDAQVQGTAIWEPSRGSLEVPSLKLASQAITMELGGSFVADDRGTRVALDLQLPRTDCSQALTSLPPGFAPQLEGMALKGELGLAARLRLDTRRLEQTELAFHFSPLGCRVLVDPARADVHALLREATVTVSGPRGIGMPWVLGPSNRDFRSLHALSPHLRAAFIAAEDARFFDHDGFDADQVKQAFVINLQQRRLLRGASTISQQLVKNVFLNHHRTLSRKFQEAVLTWRLEQIVPKERILELYLNLVEMGPSTYGVVQAARHYFGRPPDDVTPLQAAHLAALTPSPRYLGQRFQHGEPSAAWTERLRLLLRLMRRQGSISRAEQRRWSSASLSLLPHD